MEHRGAVLGTADGTSLTPPKKIALCAAGPVTSDGGRAGRVDLTNNTWIVDGDEVASALGAQNGLLINDAQATALALPALQIGHCLEIVPSRADTLEKRERAIAPAALVSPGTGLGVATLFPVPANDRIDWHVIAGEGGHVTMPACTDREAEVIRRVRFLYKKHASAEKLISGMGLESIYETLHILDGRPATALQAASITKAALAGSDETAIEALEMFCAMLGTIAGNLGLTLNARGGVFIGGGIVPRMTDFLQKSAFRTRFEDKGRLAPYMATLPTYIVTHEDPALLGLARFASGFGHCL